MSLNLEQACGRHHHLSHMLLEPFWSKRLLEDDDSVERLKEQMDVESEGI